MALPIANVDVSTDSFQGWVDKTNVLLDAYSLTIVTAASNTSGGSTTGNTSLQGTFSANTVAVTTALRGGNVTTSSVLTITSNVSVGNSTVNTVINTAYVNTGLMLSVTGNTSLTNGLFTAVTGTSNLFTFGTGNVNFDSGVLFVDAINNRVGIGNTAPGVAFRVTGDVDISATANVQGSLTVAGNTVLNGTANVAGGTLYLSNGALSGVTMMSISNSTIGSNITVAQTVSSFAKTLFNTGELVISASNNTYKQVEKLIFAHDGNDVQTTVFGRVAAGPTSANLGFANVVITGANLEINFIQNAADTKINILANLFTP